MLHARLLWPDHFKSPSYAPVLGGEMMTREACNRLLDGSGGIHLPSPNFLGVYIVWGWFRSCFRERFGPQKVTTCVAHLNSLLSKFRERWCVCVCVCGGRETFPRNPPGLKPCRHTYGCSWLSKLSVALPGPPTISGHCQSNWAPPGRAPSSCWVLKDHFPGHWVSQGSVALLCYLEALTWSCSSSRQNAVELQGCGGRLEESCGSSDGVCERGGCVCGGVGVDGWVCMCTVETCNW